MEKEMKDREKGRKIGEQKAEENDSLKIMDIKFR